MGSLGMKVLVKDNEGPHIMPTVTKTPYKLNASIAFLLPQNMGGYDGAGEFLRFTYKDIKNRTNDWAKHGEFIIASQKSYQIGNNHGLDDKMFLYVPHNCKKGGCRTHIFLHGCIQSYRKGSMLVAKRSGFLEYAATNDIVVVFPQINDPEHGYCWDMIGWTGENFLT